MQMTVSARKSCTAQALPSMCLFCLLIPPFSSVRCPTRTPVLKQLHAYLFSSLALARRSSLVPSCGI